MSSRESKIFNDRRANPRRLMEKFKFEYLEGWNWERFSQDESTGRVCSSGIQTKKIIMEVEPTGYLNFIPYEYENNVWTRKAEVTNLYEIFIAQPLLIEDDLKEAMARVVVRQWPDSPVSYYSEMPSFDSIMYRLTMSPYVQTLKDMRYSYYILRNFNKGENNGYIQVLCKEGTIEVPYIVGEAESDGELLLDINRVHLRYSGFIDWIKRVAEGLKLKLLS